MSTTQKGGFFGGALLLAAILVWLGTREATGPATPSLRTPAEQRYTPRTSAAPPRPPNPSNTPVAGVAEPVGEGCPSDGQVDAVAKLFADCTEILDLRFCYGPIVEQRAYDVLVECNADGRWSIPGSCEELASQLDCDDSMAMSEESRRHHLLDVEQALDTLRERCTAFRSVNYFLDCSRIPCVLGLPRSDLVGAGISEMQAMCFDDMLSGVTALTQYNSATLVPLYVLPQNTSGGALHQRWEKSKDVRWKELSTFPGFFKGADGPASGASPDE